MQPIKPETHPMKLTVIGTEINHHPVNLPIMPTGTDLPFRVANDLYVFTITHYDVPVNPKTGTAEEIEVFAKISKRNQGDCAKLKKYFAGASEANFQELLDTPTAELIPHNRGWAKYEELKTLRDVVTKPDWRLLKFRLLGKKSLKELKEKLAEFGLTTGMKLT